MEEGGEILRCAQNAIIEWGERASNRESTLFAS